MATYKEIRQHILNQHGIKVKTCWIAHAKELCGIPVRPSRRGNNPRVVPCPEKIRPLIREAFRHFGML